MQYILKTLWKAFPDLTSENVGNEFVNLQTLWNNYDNGVYSWSNLSTLNLTVAQTLTVNKIIAAIFQSASTNPAQSGVLRLANAQGIDWRNGANTADIELRTDSTNRLLYNGNIISGTTGLAIVGTASQITVVLSAGGATLSIPNPFITPGPATITGNLSFDSASHGVLGITTASTSAATGNVGEVVTSSVGLTNFATTANYADLTSISLTKGNWIISASVDQRGSTPTNIEFGISTTTGNSTTGLSYGQNRFGLLTASTSSDNSGSLGGYYVQPTATTTYYLKYVATYSTGTPQMAGTITAIRVS